MRDQGCRERESEYGAQGSPLEDSNSSREVAWGNIASPFPRTLLCQGEEEAVSVWMGRKGLSDEATPEVVRERAMQECGSEGPRQEERWGTACV